MDSMCNQRFKYLIMLCFFCINFNCIISTKSVEEKFLNSEEFQRRRKIIESYKSQFAEVQEDWIETYSVHFPGKKSEENFKTISTGKDSERNSKAADSGTNVKAKHFKTYSKSEKGPESNFKKGKKSSKLVQDTKLRQEFVNSFKSAYKDSNELEKHLNTFADDDEEKYLQKQNIPPNPGAEKPIPDRNTKSIDDNQKWMNKNNDEKFFKDLDTKISSINDNQKYVNENNYGNNNEKTFKESFKERKSKNWAETKNVEVVNFLQEYIDLLYEVGSEDGNNSEKIIKIEKVLKKLHTENISENFAQINEPTEGFKKSTENDINNSSQISDTQDISKSINGDKSKNLEEVNKEEMFNELGESTSDFEQISNTNENSEENINENFVEISNINGISQENTNENVVEINNIQEMTKENIDVDSGNVTEKNQPLSYESPIQENVQITEYAAIKTSVSDQSEELQYRHMILNSYKSKFAENKDWVEPHSFRLSGGNKPSDSFDYNINSVSITENPILNDYVKLSCQNTKNKLSISDCASEKPFLKRWLKKLLNKLNGNYKSISFSFTPESLNHLENLSTAENFDINAVDEFIGILILNATLSHAYNFYERTSLYEYVYAVILVLSGVLVCPFIYFLLHRQVFIPFLVILTILGSIIMNFNKMYQKRLAEKHHLVSSISETHCVNILTANSGIYDYVWEYMRHSYHNEDCKKYYESIMVDTFYEINIFVVITDLVATVFLHSFNILASTLNYSVKAALYNTSFSEKIFIFCVIICLFLFKTKILNILLTIFKYMLNFPLLTPIHQESQIKKLKDDTSCVSCEHIAKVNKKEYFCCESSKNEECYNFQENTSCFQCIDKKVCQIKNNSVCSCCKHSIKFSRKEPCKFQSCKNINDYSIEGNISHLHQTTHQGSQVENLDSVCMPCEHNIVFSKKESL